MASRRAGTASCLPGLIGEADAGDPGAVSCRDIGDRVAEQSGCGAIGVQCADRLGDQVRIRLEERGIGVGSADHGIDGEPAGVEVRVDGGC